MSFSQTVKEELTKEISQSKHCRIAEIAAVISMSGRIIFDENDKISIKIHTENVTVAKKYFTLLKKTYNINAYVSNRRIQQLNRSKVYVLAIDNDEEARMVLDSCRLIKPFGEIREDLDITDSGLLKKECCKRAFIRGAFLAAGSVSDPVKAYHYEIVCAAEAKAVQLCELMSTFGINAKVILRKRHYVVYVKDSSQVVDLLNIMGAHLALMDMENVRIVKDMRNSVNRQVNCETANINKTVNAAVKQIEDIQLIKMKGAFDSMPEALQEMAEIRLAYPQSPLLELGTKLDPPLGKAGVNHRLKKICALADQIRDQQQ